MCALVGRGVDHQHEALFRRRELRDVVVRMRTPDVLLHGAITLFLWGIRLSIPWVMSRRGAWW